MEKKKLTIIFTRYNKFVFNKYYKKQRFDYTLNIDKIMKNKIGENVLCMNKMQAFLLNYEILRLLNKVVNDDKYTNIVYVNQNLSLTSILNFKIFLEKSYRNIDFNYTIVYDEDDEPLANSVLHNIENSNKKAVEI